MAKKSRKHIEISTGTFNVIILFLVLGMIFGLAGFGLYVATFFTEASTFIQDFERELTIGGLATLGVGGLIALLGVILLITKIKAATTESRRVNGFENN